MKTAKRHAVHGITGFELSKKTLNNLSQFNLKPIAKLVLLYLCSCYNPAHGEMFPKQSTIAAKLGVSEISVTRAIQELHKEGLIISERKYTNRYKFTSKIVSERSIVEEKEMIAGTNQNESKENINLLSHDKEQINRINKPTKFEDFKILKGYAESMGARNIPAYVSKLKRNGSAERIIRDFKLKQAADRYVKTLRQENARRREELNSIIPDSPEKCERLKSALESLRKICK